MNVFLLEKQSKSTFVLYRYTNANGISIAEVNNYALQFSNNIE